MKSRARAGGAAAVKGKPVAPEAVPAWPSRRCRRRWRRPAAADPFPGLPLPLRQLARIQGDYLQRATELWNRSLQPAAAAPEPLADRRFGSSTWPRKPGRAFVAQMYLLNSRALMQMADSVEGDVKTKERVRFAVQQWVDAASPSNYLALNPDALKKAIDTRARACPAACSS